MRSLQPVLLGHQTRDSAPQTNHHVPGRSPPHHQRHRRASCNDRGQASSFDGIRGRMGGDCECHRPKTCSSDSSDTSKLPKPMARCPSTGSSDLPRDPSRTFRQVNTFDSVIHSASPTLRYTDSSFTRVGSHHLTLSAEHSSASLIHSVPASRSTARPLHSSTIQHTDFLISFCASSIHCIHCLSLAFDHCSLLAVVAQLFHSYAIYKWVGSSMMKWKGAGNLCSSSLNRHSLLHSHSIKGAQYVPVLATAPRSSVREKCLLHDDISAQICVSRTTHNPSANSACQTSGRQHPSSLPIPHDPSNAGSQPAKWPSRHTGRRFLSPSIQRTPPPQKHEATPKTPQLSSSCPRRHVYPSLGPTLDTTYCRTFFCSLPPTPSISSGTWFSEFCCPIPRISPYPQKSQTKREVLTRSRSAPASINTAAASPCPLSIAKCNGVIPALSAVFRRVRGRPSGGLRRSWRRDTDPVVAARWRGV